MNYNGKVKKVGYEYAEGIIDTRKPLGLFYTIIAGMYIGIDNSTGEAWTESFPDLRKCKEWLCNRNIEVT